MNIHAAEARQGATYFQFPLCALAFGNTEKARLDAIICYGAVEAGAKHWARFSDEERQALLSREREAGRLPPDFSAQNPAHASAIVGAQVTGSRIGTLAFVFECRDALSRFHSDFVGRHGNEPLVRLKSTLVFEARDGNGIAPRELAVLAAMYSIIGRKQRPVLITQRRIRCRALGYKTQAVMEAELSRRLDCARPFSDWQLRSLLDRLQARGFFARVTYGQRLSYYSHRMSMKELRNAVLNHKTHRFIHDVIRRHEDRAMTAAIRNRRAALAGRPPPEPDAHPLQVPPSYEAEDLA